MFCSVQNVSPMRRNWSKTTTTNCKGLHYDLGVLEQPDKVVSLGDDCS